MATRLIFLVAFMAVATDARPATILASGTAFANTNFTDESRVADNKTEDSTVSPSLESSATATSGGTTTSSDAFVNSDTGVMRATSTASGNRGDGLGDGNAVARVEISETYFITGSGTITASNKIDGNWSLSRLNLQPGQPDPSPFWQVQADIRIDTIARDFLCLGTACSQSSDRRDSGSISDQILSTTVSDFRSGTRPVTITASLLTQILTADGFIDFGNTAKMFVEFGGDITAVAADPDFLSDPAFLDDSTAVVPLLSPTPYG